MSKKKKKDIKYLGIPNVCFSLTDRNDDREKKFAKQRRKRGFDESETWSLVNTIASFTIPRLELFLKVECFDRSGFIEDAEKFLAALKLIQRESGSWMWTKEEEAIVDAGLEVFPKIFLKLWW